MSRRGLAPTLCAVSSLLGLAACGAPEPSMREAVGSSAQAISTTTILSRADEWVTADLLYCQSPNGAADPDPSCPAVCTRESNPDWDPYRSDCSGFVSWAWGLPAPGRTTDEFAPADTTVSYVIDGTDLQPGDALNIPADHIVLFVSWVTVGSEANFYEEPGCSATPPYAHAFASAVSITGSDVYIDYEGATFTAIRFTGVGVSDGGASDGGVSDPDAEIPCTVTTTGEMGECMDTSTCATLGGTSTPDYCPGPDNIQCCTGLPEATPDAATPSEAGGKPEPDTGSAHDGSVVADGGSKRATGTDSGPVSAEDPGTNEAPKTSGGAPGCSVLSARTGTGGLPCAFALTSLMVVSIGRRARRRKSAA
jgi:hypothetical protein